ncbi:MAG: hypothetical protein DLM67_26665 [Candidatus Nephthysia bennettiae]|nr:MAG: hypothetical protein DLM67_26665 [Candidatus Dormibacteraeota bacterium]
MLSWMHLSSVLVGIVIGLALGGLISWSVGRRRPAPGSDDLPPPLLRPAPPRAPAPLTVSPRTALLFAGASPDTGEVSAAASTSRVVSAPRLTEPEAHPDESLMEALRAASRRLDDEAQTRLSRESPDVPRDDPAAVAAALPRSSGQNLLELSRRLSEDTAKRLARDAEPDGA